mgnify:CR=1 FL=1
MDDGDLLLLFFPPTLAVDALDEVMEPERMRNDEEVDEGVETRCRFAGQGQKSSPRGAMCCCR